MIANFEEVFDIVVVEYDVVVVMVMVLYEFVM
jgi:hypothetical protein